ncbi:ATP-binding cassette domain-containing protein [Aridibaculum aurantiacum]|uniref:ATP-binding cassette domain-containing protein n=1 Tax=Aridibaculum aurantiacum TaxID=2810307 RepID=UPI001A973FE7|nr:ATP-binding cassette domain-containing protein [Aridibaculum aurantiacum]
MQIQLQQVVPIPLREKILARQSGIWNTQVVFAPGEWIKIKAPSGTGKTTLMNMLYKVRHDYEGNILWGIKDIRNINGVELAEKRQQQMSVIFQDLRLFPNLTARENIELKRVMGKPLYEAGVINEMAERLGVAGILHQKAGICSYGEQQRLAIIRSLMQPFKWLIMDEPFSHLDSENTKKAAALIAEECAKRNAGFILTDLDDDTNFNYTQYYTL